MGAQTEQKMQTQVLIVGAGPAGATLGAFLANYGIKSIIISQDPGPTNEPRSHFTTQASQEIFRDLGVEEACLKKCNTYYKMPLFRYVDTLTGREYFRGSINDPILPRQTQRDKSPYLPVDILQEKLEPILIEHALASGLVEVRWNTRYISHEQLSNGLVATRCHDLDGEDISIISSYLCGADGGRSQIIRDIGATLEGPDAAMTAYSVTFEADMTKQMENCPSFLQTALPMTVDPKPYCVQGVFRTVEPFTKFWMGAIPAPDYPQIEDLNTIDWMELLRTFIADDSLEIKIVHLSKWRVNERNASFYSKDNQVFCLGDAVHRHPPQSGQGSNTAMGDAYNLAWKLAHVLKGVASSNLLSSYNFERQPHGAVVVKRANDTLRSNIAFLTRLGALSPSLADRQASLALSKAHTPEGRKRHAEVGAAFQSLVLDELHTLGREMNQFYRSNAIYLTDENGHEPTYTDVEHVYTEGTIPGMRLPHAWLQTAVPSKEISTHDLAGHGRFTILKGPGGKEVWSDAASMAKQRIPRLEMEVFSIGWGQDREDRTFAWQRKREVEEDGALVIRPDRFICWRSFDAPPNAGDKLTSVLRTVLGHVE